MEFVTLFLSGMVIGVAVAAPIGPVNLICIRRGIRFGMLNGFLAGLGAAIGDGIFAIIAAFGVTAAMDFIQAYEIPIQTIGGFFLVVLGIKTWFSQPHLDESEEAAAMRALAERPPRLQERLKGRMKEAARPLMRKAYRRLAKLSASIAPDFELRRWLQARAANSSKNPEGLVSGITSTFFLTITNPATMLGFVAIFGGVAGFTMGGTDYVRAVELVLAVIAGSALWWLMLSGFVAYFRKYMNDRILEIINHISAALILLFGIGILGKVVWQLFLS